MPEIHNFNEASAVLAQFVPTGPKQRYTLDGMRALMAFLGNPQDELKVIHVAGTSGKTSTSYYVAALLQAAGKSVGLTVSPHVTEVNERVQFNLTPMPEADFCRELTRFLQLIVSSGLKLSYFEILVAFAFWQFAERNVDYAVVEVGLGGLLDGTNVISRTDKICIITDIGLDHVDRLGNTLPEIAAQKAGIIRLGNEVFCNQQSEAVLQVFKERCHEQHAALHILEVGDLQTATNSLPLFQQRNFGLAKAAAEFILQRDSHLQLSEVQLQAAIHTLIPARMETFQNGDKTIILDGSHNAQKLNALITSLKAKYPNKPVAALVSFADGKSFRLESSQEELAKLTKTIIITAFHKGQDFPHGAVDPVALAQLAKQQGIATIEVVPDPAAALNKLLSRPEPVLVVTGSFFLVHDVRPLVQKL